jgi:hypothetical protein
MKLPVPIAEKLILLLNGEKIPFSKLKHEVIDLMIGNGILNVQVQGRSKKQIFLPNKDLLAPFLFNHFGIDNLENYVTGYLKVELSRAEAIEISSNSKLRSVRTFKGFLVNCDEPLECVLNNQSITIKPQEGTFTFVYDFESFTPSPDITVVGIENPENFRQIQKQKKLFENIRPLFVSRYPQNKDLVRWLTTIPNDYVHFGDFDFAGLNIYMNEYKKHLPDKSSFFLPANIERLLSTRGNRNNYTNQIVQFDVQMVDEENVIILLRLIEKYRKGLEQELLIQYL